MTNTGKFDKKKGRPKKEGRVDFVRKTFIAGTDMDKVRSQGEPKEMFAEGWATLWSKINKGGSDYT